jgi:16S rRNA (guanine966-N2)-methyltransferase
MGVRIDLTFPLYSPPQVGGMWGERGFRRQGEMRAAEEGKSMLRVISGSAKGRRLATLRTLALRPTPDRVRQALFNILGVQIEAAAFLDLFAGSGANGLEALSRGARSAIFVEAHEPACRLIEKNLRLCGLHEQGSVWCRDVLDALPALQMRGHTFDVIFLDPPYRASLVNEALQQLGDGRLLTAQGQVIAEHFFKRVLAERYGRLCRVRVARFGDVALSFYRVEDQEVGV